MAPARRRLILRPLADRNTDQQFEYLAIDADLPTAQRFLKALRATLRTLQGDPDLGSPRTFKALPLAGMRVWPVRGFRHQLIFYIASPQSLEVVRVLHAARDAEAALPER